VKRGSVEKEFFFWAVGKKKFVFPCELGFVDCIHSKDPDGATFRRLV
jgi:hypothetical protein